MKLTQLESELLLIWFRAEMTLEQHEKLKNAMPRAYAALVHAPLLGIEGPPANLNAKRPSARRVR